MRDGFKVTGVIIGLILLMVGGSYAYLGWYKDYAPRMQDAKHKVFKQTQGYIDGKITHLTRLRLDYQIKSEAHRSALRSIILAEASTVNRSRLPYDLRMFLETLE